jgi:hypothetical protein
MAPPTHKRPVVEPGTVSRCRPSAEGAATCDRGEPFNDRVADNTHDPLRQAAKTIGSSAAPRAVIVPVRLSSKVFDCEAGPEVIAAIGVGHIAPLQASKTCDQRKPPAAEACS